MDPISHGALAASCAQSGARRERLIAAAAVGCLAGLAPDLDLLIRSAHDPLLLLEYHRHFTHSLVFAPLGALLCATLVHRLVRRQLDFAATYLFSLAGYASHCLLDACTSYGTLLLWPFSPTRVAWSNIAVVDPLFTVPVVGFVALALARRRARYARVAAVWALAYLGLGLLQHERAAAATRVAAAGRGQTPARLVVKPALGSLLLWKTIYEHDGRYYVDAVRAAIGVTVYPGASIAKLDVATQFPWLRPDSQQAADLERFRRISEGLLAVSDEQPERVIDLRYSMVPNEIASFWAIELDPRANPNAHVSFLTTTRGTPQQALRLLAMLF
jgi:inner membrane protein